MSVCSMVDESLIVNRTAYMDFKEATDELFARIDHAELAEALGVSIATVRGDPVVRSIGVICLSGETLRFISVSRYVLLRPLAKRGDSGL